MDDLVNELRLRNRARLVRDLIITGAIVFAAFSDGNISIAWSL